MLIAMAMGADVVMTPSCRVMARRSRACMVRGPWPDGLLRLTKAEHGAASWFIKA
jgi:hypothetical protein